MTKRTVVGMMVLGLVVGSASAEAQATQRHTAVADARAATRTSGALAVQGADLDARARQLQSELRCPVCQGTSILESNAKLAEQMRAVVRERLAAGETPDEIKAYFVNKYGEWILLRPPKKGFTLLVWGLPWLALLLGVAILVGSFRRWTCHAQGAGPDDAGCGGTWTGGSVQAQSTGLPAASQERGVG